MLRPTEDKERELAMARTPLLRALRGLAREHAAADTLGISVEALREREAKNAYSRKEFLKRSGAVGAAVAVTGPAAFAGAARAAAQPSIAIVGGGIAGLTAALMLQDKGVLSTVYEAHPTRVGGRMHSDFVEFPGYWANGQGGELCGELIDSGHKTILGLAQRFRLADRQPDRGGAARRRGHVLLLRQLLPQGAGGQGLPAGAPGFAARRVRSELPDDVLLHTDAGVALDQMSVYEWIESRVPGGHRSPFGQLLDYAYNIEYGAESSDQSALNLVYLLGYKAVPGNYMIFGASNERYHIVGGNTLLPLAIRTRSSPHRAPAPSATAGG